MACNNSSTIWWFSILLCHLFTVIWLDTCRVDSHPFTSVPEILSGHSCTFQAILFNTFFVFVSTVVAYYIGNSVVDLFLSCTINLPIFLPTHHQTKPIIIFSFHIKNCSELDIITLISLEIFLQWTISPLKKILQHFKIFWPRLLPCDALHHLSYMYCIVLCCPALPFPELHCTALHCTALHCTAPYLLHGTTLHCTALHCSTMCYVLFYYILYYDISCWSPSQDTGDTVDVLLKVILKEITTIITAPLFPPPPFIITIPRTMIWQQNPRRRVQFIMSANTCWFYQNGCNILFCLSHFGLYDSVGRSCLNANYSMLYFALPPAIFSNYSA